MSNLGILRTYAQKDPATLPSSILFSSTETSLTVYDAFPKSMFHFLILPRVIPPLKVDDLASLRILLRGDKVRAEKVIRGLHEDAKVLRKEIEDEMLKRYGWKWDIWCGFHAAPSMQHLHLHVLSADLVSEKMKNKKHYNSFHPKVGFFLDVNEVLSWFSAESSYFTSMAKLDPKPYEALLKEPLSCWHCGSEMKNMPTLKAHLQEEWDHQATREKAKLERKRKLEAKRATKEDTPEPEPKKLKRNDIGETDAS